jgi:hypothetical protein
MGNTYYTSDDKGRVTKWGDICFEFDKNGECVCKQTDKEIVYGPPEDGITKYPYIKGTEPPPLTPEQVEAQRITALQTRLDTLLAAGDLPGAQRLITGEIDRALNAFAGTRQYDSMASCASYSNDPDPQFALEGQYCLTMRSEVYRAGYAIMDAVKAGQRPMPTLAEVLAELPVLQWPDEAGA